MIIKSLIVCLFLLLGVSKAITVQDQSIAEGIALFEGNKLQEANKYFSNVISQNPKHALGQFYAGRISFQNGDYELADEYFDKSIKLSPKNADFYAWQGHNYIKLVDEVGFFSKMSMGNKAIAALEKAVEIDPTNVLGLVGLVKYYLGAPSIAGGSVKKAGELTQKIMKLDDVKGSVLQLQVRLRTDKESVTVNDFKTVVEKIGDNPKYSELFNTYGYYLLEQDKNQDAIIQFTRQTELNPSSANAFDSLGDGYYAAKQYEQARDAFKKALAINPDFSHAKKYLKRAEKKLRNQSR